MTMGSLLPVKPFQLSILIGRTNNHLFDNARKPSLEGILNSKVEKGVRFNHWKREEAIEGSLPRAPR